MYALLEDADAETAADPQLRAFLGQKDDALATTAQAPGCCASSGGRAAEG